MGHKAARTISFHSSRFFAIFSASPQVRLISFSSVSTLLLQVVLGLPLFLLPGGVHRSAVLGVLLFSILNTCPSNRSLLPLISSCISILLVLECSSALVIWLGQNILHVSFFYGIFLKFYYVRCFMSCFLLE